MRVTRTRFAFGKPSARALRAILSGRPIAANAMHAVIRMALGDSGVEYAKLFSIGLLLFGMFRVGVAGAQSSAKGLPLLLDHGDQLVQPAQGHFMGKLTETACRLP